jgi:ribosomal-protein-alanine N-acetyltransferase
VSESSEPPRQRIRTAGPGDFAAIQRIETVAFEPSRRSSAASLKRALRSAFQRVLVLEADDELAGYLILWPHRRTWRIYNLAADPRRQGQGVGSALLETVVAAAQRGGAERVVLECRDDPALMAFYQHRGFQARGRLPDYYSKGEHATRMEMRLPRRQ